MREGPPALVGEGSSCAWCPRQDSNLRSRLRRAVLYPLSYGGQRPLSEGFPTRIERAG